MRSLLKIWPGVKRHRVLMVAIVMLLPLVLVRWHFRLVVAVGESMLPTIKSGQVLLVDSRAYRNAQPQRGDIVVARYRGGLIVKRVVGLPGDEVEVKHGVVYLDGVPSPENHGVFAGPLDVGRGKLLEGDFATLGDNRAVPAALAIHPIVTKPEIIGRVIRALGERL